LSTKRVRSEDRLPLGGIDAAFELDPVMSPTVDPLCTMAILLAAVIAVLGLVVSYSSAAGSTDVGHRTAVVSTILPDTIVIKNFVFGSASLAVVPGTKISVVNQDRAPHTITAVNKSFDTGTIPRRPVRGIHRA
jgi:plastocyanin